MTPFGQRLRQLREERGVSQKEMAAAIRVSAAYLSALEHGRRGQPTWDLLQRMIGYLNIIWDEAEELQNLAMISHPRVTIDTAGLSPEATELANLLANHIHILDKETITNLSTMLRQAYKKHRSLR
ncbi:helix-turn-helix domain-containing protein [Hyphomicrobiales bacterium]|jgi:transcriptional regulator with XRE-family HTH domain|uniref:helix-turn-helix domain-containing protein n=1 Tax=Pseudochrobactrum asaccharolyticum TaxID=354351 RepID=UPI000EFC952B